MTNSSTPLHVPSFSPVTRRDLLVSAAAMAATLGMSGSAVAQAVQDRSTARTRVDVHQHFLPEFYRQALQEAGLSPPDNMARVPEWSVAEALAANDRLGIATSIMSVSSPGVHFGDDGKARALARRVNEEAARAVRAHPRRFGFFASTPLPDVPGALAEIAYALDVLKADGIVFETNFQGTYLGDELLRPVYAELNHRRAVVFLHPTAPNCQCSALTPVGARPRDLAAGWPYPLIEFMFETTRTVTQMMLTGTLARYPNIRMIVPHAGATLSVLAARIEAQKNVGSQKAVNAPADIRAALRTLHYDMAGSPVPETLGALLRFADPAKLHYGSDWPFTPVDSVLELLADLEQTPLFDTAGRAAMMGGNARRLFPRLG